MYKPTPINTKGIKLPEGLIELTEKIAENVHDIWAEGRIAEGWSYGEKRDDEKKHHPCLVPYSELSDSEREYDRNTAMETLKLIVALGYRISKQEDFVVADIKKTSISETVNVTQKGDNVIFEANPNMSDREFAKSAASFILLGR